MAILSCLTRSWEAAVVIQGPHYGDATRLVMRQFLSKNENILLIISTYENAISLLSSWEKSLADEGKVVYIFSTLPDPEIKVFWNSNFANQNLQRFTSCIGLRHAAALGIKYSLKIRSDVFLGLQGVVRHLIGLVEDFPLIPRVGSSIEMLGRIVVTSAATISDPEAASRHAPFHIRDHWYFGFTTDLLRFFDIDSITWKGGAGIERCSPESSLTRVWMKDLGIESSSIDELLGRYFIVEDFYRVEECRTHAPSHGQVWVVNLEKYNLRGAAHLIESMKPLMNPNLLTTHTKWKEFLRRVKDNGD